MKWLTLEKNLTNAATARNHSAIWVTRNVMKWHTQEKKPHKCSYCIKNFITQRERKQHEMTHTGEKPHKCSYCKKSFRHLVDKKHHEMTHTGEKPHKCSFCKRSFTRLGGKKRHEMTHTGEKPHNCSYCSKTFVTQREKKRHEMTHTGEKPHECSYCKKSFTRLDGKKRHEMTHRRKASQMLLLWQHFHFTVGKETTWNDTQEKSLTNVATVTALSFHSGKRNNMKWHTQEKSLTNVATARNASANWDTWNVMKWHTLERSLYRLLNVASDLQQCLFYYNWRKETTWNDTQRWKASQVQSLHYIIYYYWTANHKLVSKKQHEMTQMESIINVASAINHLLNWATKKTMKWHRKLPSQHVASAKITPSSNMNDTPGENPHKCSYCKTRLLTVSEEKNVHEKAHTSDTHFFQVIYNFYNVIFISVIWSTVTAEEENTLKPCFVSVSFRFVRYKFQFMDHSEVICVVCMCMDQRPLRSFGHHETVRYFLTRFSYMVR